MKCRHCYNDLHLCLVDLNNAPPSNAYVSFDMLHAPETWFPLRVLVCDKCWLVQTVDYSGAEELFSRDYAYFSSYSDTWLRHAETYVDEMVGRFALGTASRVVEVAANDGYLLQYFLQRKIHCIGIEPTASTALAARAKGIEIVDAFFGKESAEAILKRYGQADLMVANNVLAHVPDINDFVSGFPILLKPNGIVTFEFPHLVQLVENVQFDTIYHEHYSYLSFTAVNRILAAAGLAVFDVASLFTHGGSLRVFAQPMDTGSREQLSSVDDLLKLEEDIGVNSPAWYSGFQPKVDAVKNDLLRFLLSAENEGKSVCAYGAAAKGNTLLNYAGVRADLLPYVVDRNPAKQGKYLPGSHIPIVSESRIQQDRPDYILILPWNLREEISRQLAYVRKWGGRFVTAVPHLRVD